MEGIGAEEVVGWYEAIVAAVDSVTVGSGVTEEGAEAFAELSNAVLASLDTSPLLVAVRSDGSLTPQEISTNEAVLLYGGNVTGDGTNSLVIKHLLENDGLLQWAIDTPDLIGAVIDESLRFEPAAAAVDRYATRSSTIGGQEITRGDLVRVSLTAANRDPTMFPEPNVFDVDRANRAKHLTFARGPHSCLGIHLARAEASSVLGALVEGLHRPVLASDPATNPVGLVFRAPERVPVTWEPSKTAVQ
jgi:cytochrome P450